MINNKCFECSNYICDLACQAFPKGIPDEIMQGENDHTTPLPDQGNDIVFEPIAPMTAKPNDNK
jgi:hypothetical protein